MKLKLKLSKVATAKWQVFFFALALLLVAGIVFGAPAYIPY